MQPTRSNRIYRRPNPWRSIVRVATLLGSIAVIVAACSYDRGDRWVGGPDAPLTCRIDTVRCSNNKLQRCAESGVGPNWITLENCTDLELVCVQSLEACAPCTPGERTCDGQDVLECNEDGAERTKLETCDNSQSRACRFGACVHLCTEAAKQKSNVGCEYWAADLDNANIDETLNAAAQQFALVLSNPQPDLTADVVIERDDSEPGEEGAPFVIAEARIPPLSLRVFPLGPREVDGSPEGEYDTGTHTALGRKAYKVTSSVPLIAYQFNPLANVDVFSNDASMLKPVEALGSSSLVEPQYVVLGWPQTIASTDDPDTNFSSAFPSDLRAFLTIIAARDKTTVRVHPTTDILGGGGVPDTQAGEVLEMELDAFDVLNLETDDFNADFTGSIVESDRAVVVFSGSEASDAPTFKTLSERHCCADHLEEQLDPIRTAGKRFLVATSFNRGLALSRAGATLGVVPEPETYRAIAVTNAVTKVTTTLDSGRDSYTLNGRGDWLELSTSQDFVMESSEPIMLGNVTPSQAAAGIARGLPGGDPSFIIIPPIEQFRTNYVFLTPDQYSFDFLRIAAPAGARILLDNLPLEDIPGCTNQDTMGLGQVLVGAARDEFDVWRCQLSFPAIDVSAEATVRLAEGRQNDGVHQLQSDRKIGLIVDGFDRNVSYGYAGGTELTEIVPR